MDEANDLACRPDLLQSSDISSAQEALTLSSQQDEEATEGTRPALTPYSGSPLIKTWRPLAPLTKGAISANSPEVLSFSTRSASSVTLLRYRRVVFFQRRSTSAVSVSWARTISALMFSWMGASTVHMKRVPMLTPHAPRHRAAASPCPSAKPPEAMKGTLRDCRARERRIKLVMSDSPTCLDGRRFFFCQSVCPRHRSYMLASHGKIYSQYFIGGLQPQTDCSGGNE